MKSEGNTDKITYHLGIYVPEGSTIETELMYYKTVKKENLTGDFTQYHGYRIYKTDIPAELKKEVIEA